MRDLNDFITFLVKGEKEINESFKSKSKNNLSPEQVATQKTKQLLNSGCP